MRIDIMENVVIIGTGPAGLTAGIYTARAGLAPMILKGDQPGGQITLTDDLENFPGFPDGITGFELSQAMEKQAEKFGAKYVMDAAVSVDFTKRPFKIKTREQEFETQTVIITSGSNPRKMNVPGEQEYLAKGVSYCATCDGFFFRDKKIIVVGGGDSALDEGLYLTRFASKVTIVHRRDRLRANPHLQARAKENEKVDFILDSVVTEVLGTNETGVNSVKLKNVKTNEEQIFETDGVFVFVGHIPNTQIFKGQINLDESGIILTNNRQQTNIPGVYAAGDVQDTIYRQAITSAGTGAIAGMEAEKFLAELSGNAYPNKL